MNIWDWIILGLIAAAVYLAVRGIRKKGGCCQGSCDACGQCAQCRGKSSSQ